MELPRLGPIRAAERMENPISSKHRRAPSAERETRNAERETLTAPQGQTAGNYNSRNQRRCYYDRRVYHFTQNQVGGVD